MPALFHQHRIARIFCQHSGTRSDAADNGSTNKYGLEVATPEALIITVHPDDATVKLPAVRVAFDRNIHEMQRILRRVGNLVSDQDRPGAGAEDGVLSTEAAERLK